MNMYRCDNHGGYGFEANCWVCEIDPKTPKLTALGKGVGNTHADEVRSLNLKVGDTIRGVESGTGWWNESRLTLIWIGEREVAYQREWRGGDAPDKWYREGETVNFSLENRDWYLEAEPVLKSLEKTIGAPPGSFARHLKDQKVMTHTVEAPPTCPQDQPVEFINLLPASAVSTGINATTFDAVEARNRAIVTEIAEELVDPDRRPQVGDFVLGYGRIANARYWEEEDDQPESWQPDASDWGARFCYFGGVSFAGSLAPPQKQRLERTGDYALGRFWTPSEGCLDAGCAINFRAAVPIWKPIEPTDPS